MFNRFSIARRQAAMLGAGLAAAAAAAAAAATAATAATAVTAATRAAAAVPAPGIDPALPPPETPGVPVPPGQIGHAIAQLDGLVENLLARSGIPGLAVAVVRDGKTVYAKGFGVRKLGEAAAVDADTVFQLASLSKPVSATVVAHQVGLGGMAWDTPVIRHLPWFALSDAWVTQHVTVGDLFAHRSGLPDHAGDDLEDMGYDRREILERLRWLPLGSFREQYAYTNFGLTAAAEAVAAAAGVDWAALAQAAIYGPLGMSSTSSRFADFMDRANRAVGHVKAGGKFMAKYQRQPDAQTPAGGVSSSVNDMAKWMAMVLQGGRYQGAPVIVADALLPAVTAQMISDHGAAATARPGLYGFGFGVGVQPSGRTTISHSGAFALGAATNFMLIPSLDLGVVALSNAIPIGVVEALTASFTDLVQYGSVTRDWFQGYGQLMAGLMAPVGKLAGKVPPEHPAPPADLQDYAGIYGNEYYGPAEIARSGNGLVLKIGPKGAQFQLRHWDGPVFVYTPDGENAPEGSVSMVTFEPAMGRPSVMSIEFYAESGRGDFVRV